MNSTWKSRTALGLAVAAITTIGGSLAAQAVTPTPVAAPTSTASADATLTKDLIFMREEERLARDLYTALAAKYSQAAPFVNIARSEQRHVDSVGLLLARYGIADPSAGRAAGSYADPALQALYDKLLASGSESLAKAYEVGIAVENKDIADLKTAIAETSQADVTVVWTHLLNGSESHLSSFVAAKNGEVLGARNGTGQRNGMAGRSAGNGRQGGGQAQGVEQNRNVDRPADCPLS